MLTECLGRAYGELTESLRRAYGELTEKEIISFKTIFSVRPPSTAACGFPYAGLPRSIPYAGLRRTLRTLMASDLLTAAYGAPYGPLRFCQRELVSNRCYAYGGLRRTLRTLTVSSTRACFQQGLCLRRLTAHLTDPYGFPNANAFSTMVLLTAAYGAPYGPLRFSHR